jgi:predicted HTH domain antitoxin
VTNVVKGYVQYFLASSALIKRYMEAIEPEEQSMKSIEILVPEEIVNLLGSEEAVRQEAREAFILDLVRRGKVSKGKAAELLGISLWTLPDLIAQYQMPWFSYSQEELEKDLETLRTLKGDEGYIA